MAIYPGRNYLKNYLIIGILCVFGFLVRLISGEFSLQFNLILLGVSVVAISFSWEFLYFIDSLLNKILPYSKNLVARIATQLIIGIGFALMTRALLMLGESYIPVHLDSLFIVATWILYILSSVILNSIFFISYFVTQWKDSLVRTERLEKEKSQVQFDNLKNQLNPHFLFNALTSLNSLISDNPELASLYLQHLSKVFRYLLLNKENSFVSLSTELEFIKNYVFLMETRFQKAIQVKFTIDPSATDKAIAPVTLQILLENALKHNVIDTAKPLHIIIETEHDYLVVRNNLQIRTRVETSNKQGLKNLQSLYHYLTQRPLLIETTTSEFIVKIPLI